jgi:hypothetical protein
MSDIDFWLVVLFFSASSLTVVFWMAAEETSDKGGEDG